MFAGVLEFHELSQHRVLKPQPAITCLKLTTETLEQGKKYVQS